MHLLRLDDNPPIRYPAGRSLAEDLGRWQVAQVKSRQEKKLAKELIKKQISYFLPLYTKRTRRKDNNKIRKSILPLFTGYLAFAGGEEERCQLLAGNRVANTLEVKDQQRFVAELSQIEKMLIKGIQLEVRPDNFKPGKAVLIKSGRLAGIEGEVITRKSKLKLLVRVKMFKKAVTVELDEADLEEA